MGKASRKKKERTEVVKRLRLWHYTTEVHFKTISESGFLAPTAIAIDEKERPALWFSTNPDWERTVTKVFPLHSGGFSEKLQRDDMFKAGVTPMRVEIDSEKVKLVNWKNFKKVSGIRLLTSYNLEDSAKLSGANPNEWYATFDIVPVSAWKFIDFWNGNEWISYDLNYDLDNIEDKKWQELQHRLDRIYIPSLADADRLSKKYIEEERA